MKFTNYQEEAELVYMEVVETLRRVGYPSAKYVGCVVTSSKEQPGYIDLGLDIKLPKDA